MAAKKTMTAAEFAAVRLLINNISEDRIEAAKQYLVLGRTFKAVGADYGWSKQSAAKCVDIVWKFFLLYQAAKKAEADQKSGQ